MQSPPLAELVGSALGGHSEATQSSRVMGNFRSSSRCAWSSRSLMRCCCMRSQYFRSRASRTESTVHISTNPTKAPPRAVPMRYRVGSSDGTSARCCGIANPRSAPAMLARNKSANANHPFILPQSS